MTSAAHVDLYQLTSLVSHHEAGRTDLPVTMAFFSRKLPTDPKTGEPVRAYLLWVGLHRCLEHLQEARFQPAHLEALKAHPVLGPALSDDLLDRLADWRFRGTIRAPREGTVLYAGKAANDDGVLDIDGVRPAAYCPYLEVQTDLLSAKLIETPLLSLINHMTMVGTKASRVVHAARAMGDRQVLEFGQRRTHPEAAVDAALAAWIAGCASSSNVEAYCRYGVPISGTMDHFAIQAAEKPDLPRHQTERAFFERFSKTFPGADVHLVDTYDTFGADTGIRNAVRATTNGPYGIRIDSAVTNANLHKARKLLDELGAAHTRIFVSGGMDEHAIRALGDAPVDGYGIGERIVTSPDAPVGVGAVGKLSVVDGRLTMKLSRGSGKATLPGSLQVWRTPDGDVVGGPGEPVQGTPLLETVWEGEAPLEQPSLVAVRAHAIAQVEALSEADREPRQRTLRVTPLLEQRIRDLVEAAG